MSSSQQLLLGEGAGGGAGAAVYIEDVFSTWLYTGTGSAQTITNGIDLSTKGGLVWSKARSTADSNYLCDTVRGRAYYLITNAALAQDGPSNSSSDITSFNSTGYSLGPDSQANINTNAITFASWTFREQPKFFDVVTYTGNGSTQTVSHALGVIPAVIILKKTSASGTDWYYCYNIGASNYRIMYLNSTSASSSRSYTSSDMLSAQASTTSFFLGSQPDTNDSGATFVAYLFASNAGGFGLTGTDNVISCGSFTTDGSGNATVTLNYEPQWVMYKRSSGTGNWKMVDVMRGYTTQYGPSGSNGLSNVLYPNLTNAELVGSGDTGWPTATGFGIGQESASSTFIYVAIRRGPMKVPTVGTSVFAPVLRTGTGAAATVSTGNTPDWVVIKQPLGSNGNAYTRLIGPNIQLYTDRTQTEINQGAGYGVTGYLNTSFTLGLDANSENQSGRSIINWTFSRAPSVFDVVCYTGTGVSSQTFNHNLGVVPELMIVKCRSQAAGGGWVVYSQALGNNSAIILNSTGAAFTPAAYWNTTSPTASVFSVNADTDVGNTGRTYIAFLFATCAGVSKVGSYTGNGSTQTINCGFGAGGARFVLIKRTDSTGGWYTYDTARGMTTLTDPYLFLNDTAAETATLGSVTTVSTGFALNSAILAAINVSGGTYIFLAIA